MSSNTLNSLKRRIEVLETDLFRFKLISSFYKKCFQVFNEINENIESNEEVLDLKNRIEVLKEAQKPCFVALEKLSANQTNVSNHLIPKTTETSTQTEISGKDLQIYSQKLNENQGNGHQLSGEEVSDNDSEGIDCSINDSNDETIDGSIDENTEPNIEDKEERVDSIQSVNQTNVSNEGEDNGRGITTSITRTDSPDGENIIKNDINFEGKEELKDRNEKTEVISNESQTQIEDIISLRTLRKRKHISISGQTEDNDIESEDNSDTDIDNDFNEDSKTNSSCNQSLKKRTKYTKETDRQFVCKHSGCGKGFKRKSNLTQHKISHSSVLKYFCDYSECQKVFKSKPELTKHMNVHSGKHSCDWPGCDYKASDNYRLERHRRIHSDERQFVCQTCSQSFKIKFILNSHIRRLHPECCPDLQYLKCEQNGCEFKTKDSKHMKQHMGTVHQKLFVCDYCQKRFSRRLNLEEHKRRHTGDVLSCPLCSKQLSTTECLRHHMRTHTKEKAFQCDVQDCDKSYYTKSCLRKHKKTHENPRPFRCEWHGCEQSFPSPAIMRDHMNTHTGERPYSCEWPGCDKTFISHMSLFMHKKRHKGYLYSCLWPECDYKTNNYNNLKTHRNKLLHKNTEKQ